MARICCVCEWRTVELVTGFKCNYCLFSIYDRYRFRRRIAYIDHVTAAAVIQLDGLKCRYCSVAVHFNREQDNRSCELDHIIPARVGGNGHLDNVAVSCRGCNRVKQGRERIRTQALIWYIENEREWDVATVYRMRGLCV